jgi:hypothetical protein
MLSEEDSDFNEWNKRAGGLKPLRVAAIVMTMVGARSIQKAMPDSAAPIGDRRIRCSRYSRALILWATLLKVKAKVPPSSNQASADLCPCGDAWSLRCITAPKRWPRSPYGTNLVSCPA